MPAALLYQIGIKPAAVKNAGISAWVMARMFRASRRGGRFVAGTIIAGGGFMLDQISIANIRYARLALRLGIG